MSDFELSELAKKFVKANKKLLIDKFSEIRELIPQYRGDNSDAVQGAASIGVEKLYDYVLKNKQNAIIDGTFANFNVVFSNVKRSLDKGRRVMIIYIYQDPIVAWSFVRKREVVEGRHVPKNAFINSFFAAKENVENIKKEFGNKITLGVLVKDYTGNDKKFFSDVDNIDEYLRLNYNKEQLKLIL